MNGISIANGTNLQTPEWCFGAKAFEPVSKAEPRIYLSEFISPEKAPARDGQLELKRLAAFGRSFSNFAAQSWS
jgi:hypothetical protein